MSYSPCYDRQRLPFPSQYKGGYGWLGTCRKVKGCEIAHWGKLLVGLSGGESWTLEIGYTQIWL